MSRSYSVAHSPHIGTDKSIPEIMWGVVLALAPALACSIYFFGFAALRVTLIAVVTCIITEYACAWLFSIKRMHTITDGSSVVTGILIAFNLPPSVPWWIPCTASLFGIAVVKMMFGGLGYNIFNPALAGRIFVMASWLPLMTQWQPPYRTLWGSDRVRDVITKFYQSGPDAYTYATPLGIIKEHISTMPLPTYLDLFLGNRGGCIGETSACALVIGGVYMIYKKYITWETPVCFIGTVAILTWIFGGPSFMQGDWLLHILAGGLFLGAFYMATDMVTTPLMSSGRIIFSIGCGILTVLIRLKGGFPEGVSYAIFFMNALTPLIDRYTMRRKIYGGC